MDEEREILKPYPYQEIGIKKTLEMKRCINGDDMGLGKQQSVDCVVKTPDGDKRIGDIKVGDLVFSRDGKAHLVTGVFPQGVKPMYKITFSDDVSTEAGPEHLWTVRDQNRKRRNTGWAVYTTQQLIDKGIYCKENKWSRANSEHPVCKWEIPMCEPVEYSHKEFFIDPYIMGVLIGDGYLINGAIFSNPDIDEDIRNKVKELLSEDYLLTEDRAPACPRYRIVYSNNRHNNPYINKVRELGLNVKSGKKFIPKPYFLGDIEQRKELLSGLMDTDGTVQHGNRISYSTSSLQLALDLQKLVWSLGGQAKIHSYKRDRKMQEEIDYHVVLRLSFNPFYTSRKRLGVHIKKRTTPVRKIKKVEYIGEKEAVCIMVDEPEHTYLTDCFIVTHNTAQAIVSVERAKATPCLIVCPATLKINWERETRKFTHLRPLILTDSVKSTFPYFIGKMDLFDVVIVNYESLKKYFVVSTSNPVKLKTTVFQNVIKQFKSVIIDEAHRCKNPGSNQTKFVMGICAGKEYVIELTGTPIINDPKDLASQLAILGRMKDFGGYSEFLNEYGEGENLGALNRRLNEICYFRREKKEVLKDLPELTRSKVVTELSNRDEYELLENDLVSWLKEYKGATDAEIRKKMRKEALVKFMNLRALAGRGKIEAAAQFIEDAGVPMVVFCEHHEIVDALKERFPKAVCVTGRQNGKEKQAAVDSFQNGKRQVIICSIRSAGVGLTLTAASNELFVELPWTMADLSQCESRCHRNGQKDAVNSWILIGKDSIDGYLYSLIMRKGSMAQKITGASDDVLKDEKFFDELVDEIIKNK